MLVGYLGFVKTIQALLFLLVLGLSAFAGILIILGFPEFLKEYNVPDWAKIPLFILMFVFAYIAGNGTFQYILKKIENYQLRRYDEYSKKRREVVIDWLQKYVPQWYEKYGELIDFPYVEEDNIVDFKEDRNYDEGFQMFKRTVKVAIRKYGEFYS